MSKSVSEIMAQAVDSLVEQRISKAPFDKTYAGIISGILFEPDTDIKDSKFGTYKVRYNNAEKTFKLNDEIVHEIGERVMVYVPENNPNRMFVEPVVKRVVPYKIVYDNENDTFTEHRKIETDGKVFEIESKYKLTIQKQGDKENIVIQYPDGTQTILENYKDIEEWFSNISISDTELTFISGNRNIVNDDSKTPKTYKYTIKRDTDDRITQIIDSNSHITNITRG